MHRLKEQPIDFNFRKSEVPDNNKFLSKNNVSRNMSGSNSRNKDDSSKHLNTIITVLGLLWIVMPDLIPGPVDDAAILIFLIFSNPNIGAFMGNAFKTFLTMGGLIWVIMPDLIPGPVDDVLIIMLLVSMFTHANDRR